MIDDETNLRKKFHERATNQSISKFTILNVLIDQSLQSI